MPLNGFDKVRALVHVQSHACPSIGPNLPHHALCPHLPRVAGRKGYADLLDNVRCSVVKMQCCERPLGHGCVGGEQAANLVFEVGDDLDWSALAGVPDRARRRQQELCVFYMKFSCFPSPPRGGILKRWQLW